MLTRYLFGLRRLGLVLLAAVPLVDVVLLVASVIDIQRGGEPSFKHSLAAIFIGVSVGFGHSTLNWLDGWAALGSFLRAFIFGHVRQFDAV